MWVHEEHVCVGTRTNQSVFINPACAAASPTASLPSFSFFFFFPHSLFITTGHVDAKHLKYISGVRGGSASCRVSALPARPIKMTRTSTVKETYKQTNQQTGLKWPKIFHCTSCGLSLLYQAGSSVSVFIGSKNK